MVLSLVFQHSRHDCCWAQERSGMLWQGNEQHGLNHLTTTNYRLGLPQPSISRAELLGKDCGSRTRDAARQGAPQYILDHSLWSCVICDMLFLTLGKTWSIGHIYSRRLLQNMFQSRLSREYTHMCSLYNHCHNQCLATHFVVPPSHDTREWRREKTKEEYRKHGISEWNTCPSQAWAAMLVFHLTFDL